MYTSIHYKCPSCSRQITYASLPSLLTNIAMVGFVTFMLTVYPFIHSNGALEIKNFQKVAVIIGIGSIGLLFLFYWMRELLKRIKGDIYR